MGGKGSGFRSGQADNVDPELNSRTIHYSRALAKLPAFDRGDVDAMNERIDTFFDMCEEYKLRPLVGSFALALGMHRSSLWRLVADVNEGVRLGFTPETIETVKRAYALIESNFEHVVTSSKTPVGGIFYGKFAFGWTEAVPETITPHKTESPRLSGADIKQIADKYKAIAGVIESVEDVADDAGVTYEVEND